MMTTAPPSARGLHGERAAVNRHDGPRQREFPIGDVVARGGQRRRLHHHFGGVADAAHADQDRPAAMSGAGGGHRLERGDEDVEQRLADEQSVAGDRGHVGLDVQLHRHVSHEGVAPYERQRLAHGGDEIAGFASRFTPGREILQHLDGVAHSMFLIECAAEGVEHVVDRRVGTAKELHRRRDIHLDGGERLAKVVRHGRDQVA